jgi:flagellar basal-body rod protein FlgG
MRALKIAATGMDAQQMRVEVISHNMSNMSTTGYKARRAEFVDLHYEQVQAPGSISSTTGSMLATGVQLGMGVRPSSVSIIEQQGALEASRNDLDVAIEGKGYFEIELPNGEIGYTRDGSFKRSADGVIVTSQGHPLAANITIPDNAKAVIIDEAGQVFARIDGETAAENIGEIPLVTFINTKGLEAIGDNLFIETAASGPPIQGEPGVDGIGVIRQGYLEASAVDVVSEITDLIEAQRGYEMNSKVISTADQMMGTTSQIR